LKTKGKIKLCHVQGYAWTWDLIIAITSIESDRSYAWVHTAEERQFSVL